ncbi:MAG: hypothetical protein AB7F22_27880 [Reyranella sp.]|uniref:hypothetical protein n=1 Tax=Reyranella sp. TaxID=1929291 RepID=UPI003D0FD5FA
MRAVAKPHAELEDQAFEHQDVVPLQLGDDLQQRLVLALPIESVEQRQQGARLCSELA